MTSLNEKIGVALGWIERAQRESARQLLAYSGGKDALVVAHLAAQLGIRDAVCETSFSFARQREDAARLAEVIGLRVSWSNRPSLEWLRRHPELLFSEDPKLRGWSFGVRQQETVKRHARVNGYDCQIFGRRTEENTVPSHLYRTRAGLQCHPIRDWREGDVWAYLDRHAIPRPWIYSTWFGRTGPFYAVKASEFGGVDRCWELVAQLDPTITRERILGIPL